MTDALHPIQIKGLHKIGGVFYRDFAAHHPEDLMGELLAAQGRLDRIAIHGLLWAGPVLPRAAVRLLLRCEDPKVSEAFYGSVATLFVLLKALCSVLYYAKNDPRREGGAPPA